MTLRTRLILWLLLMSVVPLGAVTVYTYVSSANALRGAAAREADLLAGELSSRMQLVTTELSSRVEQLMNMPETTTVARTSTVTPVKPAETKPATTTPTAADATADKTKSTADDEDTVDTQVAQALGDAAMLLNSVELQGVRNLFRTGGSGRTGRPGGALPAPGSSPTTTQGGRGGDAGATAGVGGDPQVRS